MSRREINPGRNLPVATAVGLLLLAALIASLSFNRWWFAGYAAVAALLAAAELARLLNARGAQLPAWPVGIATAAMVLFGYGYGLAAALTAASIGLIALVVARLRLGVAGYTADVTAVAFVFAYVGAGLTFAADLANSDNGFGRVMTLVLLTAASDTGGYFAGIIAGRHPMVPSISPKKSWEGFAGSLTLALVIGGFAVPRLVDLPMWQGMLLGAVITLTATTGDLVESAIKRDAGAKDSGDVIPGHGGMLDRIDGVLVSAPVAWLLLTKLMGV